MTGQQDPGRRLLTFDRGDSEPAGWSLSICTEAPNVLQPHVGASQLPRPAKLRGCSRLVEGLLAALASPDRMKERTASASALPPPPSSAPAIASGSRA